MSTDQGTLISNLLNGYRQRDKNTSKGKKSGQMVAVSKDEVAIDPNLLEEVEDVPSSPLLALEEPIDVSSQTHDGSLVRQDSHKDSRPKSKVNLKSLLSGYVKKPKSNDTEKKRTAEDVILVEESPVKRNGPSHLISDSLETAKSSKLASFLNRDRANVQRPNKRCKEQEWITPFPKAQHTPRYTSGQGRSLSIPRRKPDLPKVNLTSDESEYSSFFKSCIDYGNTGKQLKTDNGSVTFHDDTTNIQLWTTLFKPTTIDDVLIDADVKYAVKEWFQNAFHLLNKKTDRSALFYRKPTDDIDDFVVDDSFLRSEDEGSVTEFVPLIILYGGVGKNTLVDVLMAEQDAHIFEINCSMNRAKRDIYDTLHDFATTKYVKDTQSKGIILFDDVDVLLTESDKFFWNSVHAMLTISRRPIVITCNDYRFIPANLLEVAESQGSIFKAKPSSHEEITSYLERCLKRKGIQIPPKAFKQVLRKHDYNIRECLTNLQWICTRPGRIELHSEERKEVPLPSDFREFVQHLDFVSCSDLIETQIEGRSFLKNDIDSTLNYATHQIPSDPSNPRDVLWDYSEHLWDTNYNSFSPWEMRIHSLLNQTSLGLSTVETFEDGQKLPNIDMDCCIEEMLRFLRTRVYSFPQGNVLQMISKTRSSRRKNGNVKDYRLKSEEFSESDPEQAEAFQIYVHEYRAKHKPRDIVQWYLPTVIQIAHNEGDIRRKNVSLFHRLKEHHKEAVTSNDIINEMVKSKLILPAFFKGSPESLLHAYSPYNN